MHLALWSCFLHHRDTMEEYICDSLAARILSPSSSPVGAGFFFVDKTHSPCINFHEFNHTMVKNKYPLPSLILQFSPCTKQRYFLSWTCTTHTTWCELHKRRMENGFQHPLGLFQYFVMPFGFIIAT